MKHTRKGRNSSSALEFSPPLPDFLLGVSRRAAGEAEEPDNIEVAVFVEIADEADVELPKALKLEIPLAGVLGF